MNKKIILGVMILLLGFLIVSAMPSVSEKKKIPSKRETAIQKEIIEQNDNPKLVYVEFSDKNKEYIKKTIGNKIRYEFSGKVSAYLSNSEINDLLKDEKIDKIREVRTYSLHLQDTARIINSTKTWTIQQNYVNLTGKGQAVCVIDTGVDYSHSDLGGCYGNNDPSSECKVIGGYDYCADNMNCATTDSIPDDINGHGTHIAGIVAANGILKGIAPEARIIALKACNSSGTCFDDSIEKSIIWCTNNASKFNISVISMSFGGGAYEEYCNSDSLASAINNATTKNISVVASSGNEGYYNGIASPACIQNATPVSSNNKEDNQISLFANTWNSSSLVILTAPGELINSTKISGGYIEYSGTSMSAPHVSGVIAILRQYLSLTGQTKTPDEIEILLNNTGKQIWDNYAKRNFSRVDVYSALLSLDNQAPNVSLISPANGTGISGAFNQTFRCNASDIELKNVTFFLWNTTSIYNQTSQSVSGTFNNFEINLTNIPFENYSWNCLYSDHSGKQAFSLRNNSIIPDLISPVITILSPLNNSWQNAGRFNLSLNEAGMCWYSLNSGVTNYTMTANSSLTGFNATNTTLLQDIMYNVTYYCNDTLGNKNSTAPYFFNIDLISPNVSLVEPLPESETSNSAGKIFYYNVTDNLNLSRCDLIVNGDVLASNSSAVRNDTNNLTASFSAGNYVWHINCTDEAGNTGNSSFSSFTITAPSSGNNNNQGGSVGGGGAIATQPKISKTNKVVLSETQIHAGYNAELGLGDKIIIPIVLYYEGTNPSSDEKNYTNIANHTITIDELGNNSIRVTIRSEPIKINLSVGETKKLNITNAGYYDLLLRLDGINSNTANLFVKAIYEKIDEENTEKQSEENNQERDKVARGIKKLAIVAGAILLALALAFILNKANKRTKKPKKKQNSR